MLIRVKSVQPTDLKSPQRKVGDFGELSIILSGKLTGFVVRDAEFTMRNSYHEVEPTTLTRYLERKDLEIDVFGSEMGYSSFRQIRISQFPENNSQANQLKAGEYFAKVRFSYYVGAGDYPGSAADKLKETIEIPINAEYTMIHFDPSENLWIQPRPLRISEYPAKLPAVDLLKMTLKNVAHADTDTTNAEVVNG